MQPLISGDGGASSVPLVVVKVVEYLQPSMSTELLYKFPDNSAYDFDYTQSSIWSPLLPPPDSTSLGLHEISRKLSFGGNNNDQVGLLENTKRISARIKRKFTDIVIDNISRCGKRKRKSLGFSPVPSSRRLSSSSSSPKVWAKVMKAAAKHFKKRKNKKKDPNLHLDLYDYLTES